jgi:hypothetical protein
MTAILEAPPIPADRLGIGESTNLSAAALDATALEALRQEKITEYELGILVGISDRYARDAFLKAQGVDLPYTPEDFERELKALRELDAQNR